ncbi:MAG: DsbA family protein [Nitrospiraceae bacterium]|nr:DsbA family protein [Nitrospiraceae bacterium]
MHMYANNLVRQRKDPFPQNSGFVRLYSREDIVDSNLYKFIRVCFMSLMAMVLTLPSLGILAGAEELPPTDPAWVNEVEAVVRKYLQTHPEVIVESLRELEERRQQAEVLRSQKLIDSRTNELLNDPASPASGNLNGNVAVVQFFDYRCGFCKQVADAVSQLQRDDENVRVIYKDFPILGEPSIQAAKAALAARKQGKHLVFHEALMRSEHELTKDSLLSIASQVGLDAGQLEKEMQSPELQSILDRNRILGNELGITGTPGFIIGTNLKLGAVDLYELKAQVLRARGQYRE